MDAQSGRWLKVGGVVSMRDVATQKLGKCRSRYLRYKACSWETITGSTVSENVFWSWLDFTVSNLAAAFYPEVEVNNGRIKSEHFMPDKCSFVQAQMSATSTRGVISA